MNRLSMQIGRWSAFLSAVVFIAYTVCFVGVLVTAPVFTWTNLSDYAAYVTAHSQIFKEAAMYLMLIFGPLFVVLLSVLHDYARDEQKILTRIGLCFGLAFAILSGMNYFVQLSVVRQNVLHGQLTGLEQFVQANPASAITGINMLGWTLFLGLASLFVAPIFSGGRLEKMIKWALIANGVCCLLGGLSYIYELSLFVFLFVTFGMGGAVTAASIGLGAWFNRMAKSAVLNKIAVSAKPLG